MIKVANPKDLNNYYTCETMEEAVAYVEMLEKYGIKLIIIPTQS